jgi:glycosyltransferase involved in cell wall biosynthesis
MRLALLTNNRLPPREGVARHVLETGRRLVRRGHEVTILARGHKLAGRERSVDGVRLVERPDYPLSPLRHLSDRSVLGRWLAAGAEGADLIHVHLPLLPPLPTRAPLMVTFHSPMLTDSAAIHESGLSPVVRKLTARLVSRRFEDWYLRHADRIVAVSRGVRDELVLAYGVPARHMEVVPNGVDTEFFRFAPMAGREPKILYVGRLHYRKGLFRLLEAMAWLKSRNLQLVLAGEGPLLGALTRHATSLGLGAKVRFVGFLEREALRRELETAACVVNPADYESGPLVLLEAMAAGAPVVSTPTGLARELGPQPPILVAAPEPTALATAITACLADPEAAAARAIRARSLVEREYGWERVVDRLEAIYGIRERLAA